MVCIKLRTTMFQNVYNDVTYYQYGGKKIHECMDEVKAYDYKDHLEKAKTVTIDTKYKIFDNEEVYNKFKDDYEYRFNLQNEHNEDWFSKRLNETVTTMMDEHPICSFEFDVKNINKLVNNGFKYYKNEYKVIDKNEIFNVDITNLNGLTMLDIFKVYEDIKEDILV